MLTFEPHYFLISSIFLQIISVKTADILIFHTSDIHGYFHETFNSVDEKPVGGFARIAHVLNEAKQNYRNDKGPAVLYFDTGNVFIGSPWFTIHRDKIAVAMMNALKPDAVCLGTTEFSYGIDGLMPYISKLNFPVVVSNLNLAREPGLAKFIKNKHIITIGSAKIGILGYIKNRRSTFGNLVPTVEVLEEVEIITTLAESLRRTDGVDIIIVLSHGGLLADVTLSRLVRYVDIIIGGTAGHYGTFMWNGKQPDMEKPTDVYPIIHRRMDGMPIAIAHAHQKAKYLGKLRVKFDETRRKGEYYGQPIFLDDDIPQNKHIMQLLDTFRKAVTVANETFLGKSRVILDAKSCSYKECNFGNLISDSFVQYNAKRYLSKYERVDDNIWTDAAIGLINIGAIRENINPVKRKSNVYKLDLLASIPFNNFLSVIRISGTDLLHALEHAAKGKSSRRGSEFLIPSGLRIVYDFARPDGKRVKSVLVKCADCRTPKYEPIVETKSYGIITTEFIVKNGDGHLSLDKTDFLSTSRDYSTIDSIEEYFDTYQVVAPEIEGRIIIENPITSVSPKSIFLDKLLCLIFIILLLN